MRNILFPLIFSMFLAACGSGSESDIDHKQLARFKGLELSPELTFLSSTESGGYIALNQSISGEITGSETASFNYSPSYSGYASLQFDSPSEGVWFRIEEDGEWFFPRAFRRGRSSVFYLSAGRVYTFELYQYFVAEDGFTPIEKPGEIGEFEISLADLSRQSLQLTENEFLLELNYNGSVHEEGRPANAGYYPEQAGSEDYRYLVIMNFLDGYKIGLYQESEVEYAQVSGSSFEFRTQGGTKQSSDGSVLFVMPETQEAVMLDAEYGTVSGLYHHEYDIGLEQEMFGLLLWAEAEELNSRESIFSTPEADWLRISEGTITGKIIL